METSADLLTDEARALVDHVLTMEPPLRANASDEEIATYCAHVRDALQALQPWRFTVSDQLETVALFRVLTRLHEMHWFTVTEDDGIPSLKNVVSTYRQCADRVVASLACTLFARMCALVVGEGHHQSEVNEWVRQTLGEMPPPPPSPSTNTPAPKRKRGDES